MKKYAALLLLILPLALFSCVGQPSDAGSSTGTAVNTSETVADTPDIAADTSVETTGAPEDTTSVSEAPVLPALSRDSEAPADLPALYIELDDGKKQAAIKRNEYRGAVLALDGMGFCDDVRETAVSIKGRGNYSWGLPKKPYNIKFEEKVDLCGMGSAKKWALVTTYSDKSLLRNYLTLNFALDIGMDYGMDCRLVNLYVNGDFQGVYLLTERVQINDERIDISKETGRLFEIEMEYRHDDCSLCIETNGGVHLTLAEPEEIDVGSKEIGKILRDTESFLNKAEKAMRGESGDWSEYIDAESFVNWYIVNEFCKNYDSIFVTSCYCFIDDSGKLAMGPPWDFDTCYGNQNIATCLSPKGYYIADAPWYELLFKGDDFRELVCDKWTELREDGVIDRFFERIDGFRIDKVNSINRNYEKWPQALKATDLRGRLSAKSFDDETDYLREWIEERIEWFDSEFLLSK